MTTNNDRDLWEKERELDEKYYPLDGSRGGLDGIPGSRSGGLDEWLFAVLAAVVVGCLLVSWVCAMRSLYQRLSHPPAAVEAIR